MDLIKAPDAIQYTYARAEWVAVEYSGGSSLQELFEAHPELVPPPLVIRRWRRDYPAFDMIMSEAEKARAEVLADQTIGIADDEGRTAAQATNAIKARQWLASRLDKSRYGDTSKPVTVHNTTHDDGLAVYTDEQLQAIIRGAGMVASIEGHGARKAESRPGTPPDEKNDGARQNNGGDLSGPKIFSEKDEDLF